MVPGVAAGQLTVAVPDVLLDVLDDRPDAVGCPGAPGTVTLVPPVPGMWITVSEYGPTVTADALPGALVIEVALSASVYTVGVPDGVNPLVVRATV